MKYVGVGIEGRPVNNTIEKDLKKIQENFLSKDDDIYKETTDRLMGDLREENGLDREFNVEDIDLEAKLNDM